MEAVKIREGRHTVVYVLDEPGAGGACHLYRIEDISRRPETPVVVDGRVGMAILEQIRFQNGPIEENGVNGVQNEDLLAIVIHRLQGFQSVQFACRENAIALTKCQEALMWLDKRTADRVTRGVEGKNVL
jgi:hypothetical protein